MLEANYLSRREILEIEARSAARLVESNEDGIRVSSSQACFPMPEPQRP